jgi:hypothetical protein
LKPDVSKSSPFLSYDFRHGFNHRGTENSLNAAVIFKPKSLLQKSYSVFPWQVNNSGSAAAQKSPIPFEAGAVLKIQALLIFVVRGPLEIIQLYFPLSFGYTLLRQLAFLFIGTPPFIYPFLFGLISFEPSDKRGYCHNENQR